MQHILFIAIGGAVGAVARYLLSSRVHGFWEHSWPLGTLLVNASGSLLIGIVFVLLEKAVLHPDWRSVLMVGFLGAFTTFSTFSLETVELWLRGETALAMGYAVGSTLVCVLAAAAGLLAARSLLA